MELQLPLIRRILAEHQEVEYHVWNFARNNNDNEYLRSLTGERIRVINDWYGQSPWIAYNEAWKYYAHDEFREQLFVKIDDDVVFIETDRFSDFLDAINTQRGSVVSAKVVNNGACVRTEPSMWLKFKDLDIPLLDVHLHSEFADMCHNHILDHPHEMIGQQVASIPTEDWLSINLIGFDWPTLREMASRLGQPSPPNIAGRDFSPSFPIGDEGMVNQEQRLILNGFVACHLTFGPQEKDLTDGQISEWRQRYAHIGKRYIDKALA